MNNEVHKLTDWISRSDLLNSPRLLREMFLWIHRRDQLADRSSWQELFFSRFSLKQKNPLNILNTLRQICLLYKYLYWWKTTSELLIRAFYDPSDGLQYLSTSSIKPKMWNWLYTNDLDKHLGWIKAFMSCVTLTLTDSSVHYIYVEHSSDINWRLQEHNRQDFNNICKRSISSKQWAKATN